MNKIVRSLRQRVSQQPSLRRLRTWLFQSVVSMIFLLSGCAGDPNFVAPSYSPSSPPNVNILPPVYRQMPGGGMATGPYMIPDTTGDGRPW